ncbi:MAG TPA: ABC transporter ATP-binding protein [Vicinamibacterales bacterium]
MTDPAIRVDHLVKIYRRAGAPELRAVDDLSFTVRRGGIFGLLGPNGAGKTTTLRILTTIVRPTSGTAAVLGYDVASEPLEVRRRIGVVIQEQAADLLLTVRENLLTFARFHGLSGAAPRRRADEVMAWFDLQSIAARKVQDLSGGSRRRVQVAKMFMVDLPIIFLDEFSAGMDPILKRAVMDRLRGEAARGRTIVLTTHVLTEAEELCDDILIINKGRRVAHGSLNALKLLTDRLYDVILSFERLPDGLAEIVGAHRPDVFDVSHNTVHLRLRDEESRVLELVAALSKKERVLRVEINGASLEDVFVALTRGAEETR